MNVFAATTVATRAPGIRGLEKSMAKFWVIDGDENTTSWEPDGEAAECFDNEGDAELRAKSLAKSDPSRTYFVCKPVKAVSCTISEPAVSVI